ncbi:HD-GYP domain-containing protein [Metallumcola ferriviriculae]|uniref:HD-GYP domain-containing protein n=1 Tax=Metallumcola ferriviriculae TaxID=3039180 RepID=A0AAU0UQJ6_9FIRM|nr:HD-GYP domain-containing protein [Desulfitibacteraceae bacterium MK1]
MYNICEKTASPRFEESLNTVVMLLTSLLETKDIYTSNHSQHVAKLAKEIAKKLGMNKKETELVYVAGLLHDIGKIAVPAHILQKPGKLTRTEFEDIKMHSEIGYRMLQTTGSLFTSVLPMVRHHHERWDGTGYPGKLKGAQIPRGAAVLAVADAYDAMVSNRPYRIARVHSEVLEEIKECSGSQLSPQIVAVFLDNYQEIKNSVMAEPLSKRISPIDWL